MRFQLGNPQFDPRDSRWYVVVEAYVGSPGTEQLYARQVGVLKFGTEDAALEAGQRTLKVFDETARLPKIF